jgi:hypothetical protein
VVVSEWTGISNLPHSRQKIKPPFFVEIAVPGNTVVTMSSRDRDNSDAGRYRVY